MNNREMLSYFNLTRVPFTKEIPTDQLQPLFQSRKGSFISKILQFLLQFVKFDNKKDLAAI